MIDELLKNFLEVMTNFNSLSALLGIFLLIIFLLYSRKIKFTTGMLASISLLLALTILLHFFSLYRFPQGGQITLGSEIPLILLAWRYGAGVGFFAGFVYGFLNIIQDPFIVHPIQVLFDYPLPCMCLGLAGIFPKKIFLSTTIAFFAKFLCHFISGVVFFGSFAPEGVSPIMYSLTTNLMFIVPELVICCVILKFLPVEKILSAIDSKK